MTRLEFKEHCRKMDRQRRAEWRLIFLPLALLVWPFILIVWSALEKHFSK